MKRNKFWFLSILTSLILPSALAAPGDYQQGLFGDIIQRATIALQEFLTYTLVIPHPYPIGNYQTEVPLWGLLAMFTLVFAVIYAASAKIKIFDENHKGARKAFCAAVAIITLFGTPITEMLIIMFAGYFTTLTSLLMLVGFIIGLWFIIFVIPSRTGGMSKWAAEGAYERAEGKQLRAEARKMKDDAYIEKKSSKRSKRAFNKIRRFLWKKKNATGDLRNHLLKIRQKLFDVERIHESPSEVLEAKNIILKEFGDVIPIIDKEMRIDDKSMALVQKIRQLQQHEIMAIMKEGNKIKSVEAIVAQEKAKVKNEKNLDVSGLEAYFRRVVNDEKILIRLRNEIGTIERDFKQLDINIKGLIERAMQEVRANNINQAIRTIDAISPLIGEEDNLISRLLAMEQEINGLENRDYNLEKFIIKKEKKVVTTEKKDEKLTAEEAAKLGTRF